MELRTGRCLGCAPEKHRCCAQQDKRRWVLTGVSVSQTYSVSPYADWQEFYPHGAGLFPGSTIELRVALLRERLREPLFRGQRTERSPFVGFEPVYTLFEMELRTGRCLGYAPEKHRCCARQDKIALGSNRRISIPNMQCFAIRRLHDSHPHGAAVFLVQPLSCESRYCPKRLREPLFRGERTERSLFAGLEPI